MRQRTGACKTTLSGAVTALLFALGCVAVSPAGACSVPVFRYALERWRADPYRLVVFSGEALDSESAVWQAISEEEDAGTLLVESIDVSGEAPENLSEIWAAEKEHPLPRMILMYPPVFDIDTPIWRGPMTEDALRTLVDSPARRRISEKLAGGDTAVWVFMESGDETKDSAALAVLASTITNAEAELRLPHELDPGDTVYDLPMTERIDLRIDFSIIELSRSDRAESVLIRMLLNTEPDLPALNEPMAFAVFGHGRILPALAGRGINADNVMGVCAFLVGPCSCQVKTWNPGVDMLLPADWNELLESMIGEDELPPLTVPLMKQAPLEGDTEKAEIEPSSEPVRPKPILRNTMIAVVLGVLILLSGTWLAFGGHGKGKCHG